MRQTQISDFRRDNSSLTVQLCQGQYKFAKVGFSLPRKKIFRGETGNTFLTYNMQTYLLYLGSDIKNDFKTKNVFYSISKMKFCKKCFNNFLKKSCFLSTFYGTFNIAFFNKT